MFGEWTEGTWESLLQESIKFYKVIPKRRRLQRQSDEPIVVLMIGIE